MNHSCLLVTESERAIKRPTGIKCKAIERKKTRRGRVQMNEKTVNSKVSRYTRRIVTHLKKKSEERAIKWYKGCRPFK